MQDTQAFPDQRMVKIAKVGITEVNYPILFQDQNQIASQVLPSTANFSFFVELPAHKKGTHMSRFPSILYEFGSLLSIQKLEKMAAQINERLESSKAYIKTSFQFFYEKEAPVSKIKGIANVDVTIEVSSCLTTRTKESILQVKVPIKSLCPCSKAISEYGAHSQRSFITLRLWQPSLSIQDCIKIAELSASSAVYPILKRVDEKFVTEKAYNTPRFVEDLVREAAIHLKEKDNSLKFEITAENFESIHNHNAWAFVTSDDLF
ncbi:GTP cyclohydrolase FolE2 [Pigmentibacter sp. JX0631]|uniref:GTP cyclohydrolase FolE2 n=1 Tax=Pigmentibacter sp. JX0631 TaxID=2976982 RepID=UPI002468D28F|nr:GTP cyclohydrolase FolE2 [Pigmentibacter sp. JX0631]WGL59283.1 GTP cyclohydrolase FolE2 [Pigmentibacter sp. JX0631]